MRIVKVTLFCLCSFLLVSCATTTVNSRSIKPLSMLDNWGILPFQNYTTVPQANKRVAAIATGLFAVRGVQNIYIYPEADDCKQLIPCVNPMPSSIKLNAWVEMHDIHYLIKGSVNEWSYKVGLDGEPAANITLQIIDANTNTVVWSSVGSKAGSSRSGLSDIGQRLLNQMLSQLPLA